MSQHVNTANTYKFNIQVKYKKHGQYLYKHFWPCGVGLPLRSGSIVAAGMATYLHPAVCWRTTDHHEDGLHRAGQLPLSGQ